MTVADAPGTMLIKAVRALVSVALTLALLAAWGWQAEAAPAPDRWDDATTTPAITYDNPANLAVAAAADADRSGTAERRVAAASGPLLAFSGELVAPSSALDDLARPALPRGGANLSQQRLDHIVERHWFGSQTANAGHFAKGTTGRGLKNMIDDAVRNGSFRPNTRGRPGTIFEYDFGGSIGTNIRGNATSRLRVVVDPNGNVTTAFPY